MAQSLQRVKKWLFDMGLLRRIAPRNDSLNSSTHNSSKELLVMTSW